MKIMHLADFHLDSAFSGFDKVAADEKRAQLVKCFERALDIADERGVSLILIAGDLFDTPFCSAATKNAVFEAIRNARVPVVIAPGNHDFYTKNGTYAAGNLPENAYVFTSDELGRFDFDALGVSVIGYAFTSDRYEKNPLSGEVPLSEENVNILCAHADLGSPLSKYAPLGTGAIARCGFAYAALGHVHKPQQPTTSGASLIAYSGFAQGRSFDETGDGGALIIDLDTDSKTASYERVILSTFSYEIAELDVTGAERDEDVTCAIENLIELRKYGKHTALRVILGGSLASDYTPNCGRLCAGGEALGLALLQIKDRTGGTLDADALETDVSIRGGVYRALKAGLCSDDEAERHKATLALKFALSALDSREFGID